MDSHVRGLPKGTRTPLPIADDFGGLVRRVGAWFGSWHRGVPLSEGLPSYGDSMGYATEQTAAAIPAVWKCGGFLANAVASCAPPTEFDSDGMRVDVPSPVAERPWSLLTAHEFWVQVVLSLLFHGNFVGLKIDPDEALYPRQVLPLPADMVRMAMDPETRLPIYGYAGEVYAWDEVVHVRNGYMTAGSLWGVGVVQQFRESLTRAEDVANYGAAMFRSAAENSVVIQVDRPTLEEAEANAVQELWVARHASGIRRPAVIPASMTITPLSFSPEDAQFLESRQFSVAEIAFMFLMDPTDLTAVIGQGGMLTYANREQREIERLTHPVGHLMRRIEQAWADLLPGRRSIAFNVERLLRTDTLSRLTSTNIGLENGTFTLNDARTIERLPLYGEWADVPFAKDPNAAPDAAPTPPTAEAV